VSTQPGLADRHVGRYVLDDLVAERSDTMMWRATDPALQRPVGVRLVPLTDSRCEALYKAARAAASVDDRRLVAVLDVFETDEYLVIVTEWVNGQAWSDLLTERWTAQESMVVAKEVGLALEKAHAAGVTHGRIRPDSVMITDTREVRLRGLGVEAAVWGSEPPGDPKAADLHGVGALLYAGVTLRWPCGPHGTPVAGMRPAPVANGQIPSPSAFEADVPPVVDAICAKSMLTSQGSEPVVGYAGVAECVLALDHALGKQPTSTEADEFAAETEIRADRWVGRLSTAAVFLFAIAGVGLLLWQLLVNNGEPDSGSALADGSASQVAPIPPFEAPLPESSFTIASAQDFDPGGDDAENPDLVEKAIDGRNKTAWVTAPYPNANMNPKEGVGLVLDMGTVRSLRALDLKLYGSGSDFQVLTSKKKPKSLDNYRTVAEITGAGNSIKVRTSKPVRARYVMIWFTGLPYDGANYVGGVRDVKIEG